jgi:hypothetical protein
MGQTRPKWAVGIMSGLPPTATEMRTSRIGSFVPQGDIIGAQAPSLLFSGKRTRVSAIDNGRHRVDQATPDELQLI